MLRIETSVRRERTIEAEADSAAANNAETIRWQLDNAWHEVRKKSAYETVRSTTVPLRLVARKLRLNLAGARPFAEIERELVAIAAEAMIDQARRVPAG